MTYQVVSKDDILKVIDVASLKEVQSSIKTIRKIIFQNGLIAYWAIFER